MGLMPATRGDAAPSGNDPVVIAGEAEAAVRPRDARQAGAAVPVSSVGVPAPPSSSNPASVCSRGAANR
jgi:hypothetical protein